MVVLRIVCVFVVLWGSGILAAPTVTYDQRQHGDFNLQVDLDDVAILLMPGSEFAQRSALSDKVYKIFGRRNGGHSKKKQKNCSTTTTTTTTTSTTSTTTSTTERPYSEVPPSSTSQGYEEVAQGPEEAAQGHDEVPLPPTVSTAENANVVAESDTNDRPGAESADRETAVSSTAGDVLSVTPAKVLATDYAAEQADDVVEVDDVVAAVKTEEKSAVVETATGLTEMVVVKTVEKSAAPTTANDTDDLDGGVKADVKPIEADYVEEKQPSGVSAPSDVKAASGEAKKPEETATGAVKAEDVVTPSEKSNIAEKPEKLEDTTKTLETENKSAETNAAVVKPVQVAVADEKSSGVTQTEKITEPVEMVVMKTMEKPTFAEALKVVKKPVDADAAVSKGGAAVVTDKGVPSSDVVGKELPTEMIAMKTVEKPSSTETSVDRSGIAASAKPTEVQEEDKKTPAGESVETIVSRSSPKLTEMVAVKTMENPATVSTVKSVVSVKTVIRPGTPKTTILSTSSSITRKVGDRKPLPSVSFDVAPPKVV